MGFLFKLNVNIECFTYVLFYDHLPYTFAIDGMGHMKWAVALRGLASHSLSQFPSRSHFRASVCVQLKVKWMAANRFVSKIEYIPAHFIISISFWYRFKSSFEFLVCSMACTVGTDAFHFHFKKSFYRKFCIFDSKTILLILFVEFYWIQIQWEYQSYASVCRWISAAFQWELPFGKRDGREVNEGNAICKYKTNTTANDSISS